MASVLVFLGFLYLIAPAWAIAAQDKLKYGSSVKHAPQYYLPVMAAEEKGIWKRNGLDVEWFPFRSGSDLHRAFAAGAIKVASSTAASEIVSVARGVPTVILANLQTSDGFVVWVPTKSRFQKPQDLRGAKLGVSRFGGTEHSYGQLVAKQLGLASEVQFVSTGGIKESLAALTTGSIDGVVLTSAQMIDLKLQGRVKELLLVENYQAQPWASYVIVARRDFVQNEPDTVRRVVKSILEANRFVMSAEGVPWSLAKMKEINNYSDAAAKLIYDTLNLSQDGKLEQEAIKNLTNFMVEYGVIKGGEVPAADSVFTDRFIR